MLSTWILTCTLLAQSPTPVIDQAPQAPLPPVVDQAAQPQATPAVQTPATPLRISPWTDDQPITHLVQNLGKDLRALGSAESVDIMLVGGGLAALMHTKDNSLAFWVQQQPPASYPNVGNAIGNGVTQAGAAVGVWVLGKMRGNDELSHIGSDLIRAQALNEVLTGVIKVSANRPRPNGGTQSFPSGHTSATFATAAVLQSHFGWGVGMASYAVGSFVGWSRIRSNYHYLSDVVFGAAIGAMSGRAVAGHHTSKWTVAPVRTPGGFAVVVTRGR
jgi:hypothetical protein